MKILSLSIQNYLGVSSLETPAAAPIILLAAHNGAGKSSTIEAVRHALGGDAARVAMKKNYSALLTHGAAQGFAEIATDAGTYSIVLPSGKGNHHSDEPALPFVLDARRFAAISADDRRTFLFGLMHVSSSGAAVLEMLKARGCDATKAEAIAADLRAGFPAAAAAAQAKARDSKADWKAATGGETWGKDKASGWKALRPAETYDRDQVRAAEDLVNETDAQIEATNRQIGELRAAGKQRADAEARAADLRQRAARLPSLREKLARDEAEHAEWSAKLAALPPAPGEKPRTFACPCCGVLLVHRMEDGALVEYHPGAPADPELERRRKQQQDAVDLYARSVANDRRDIAAAEAAAAELAEIDKTLASLPAVSPAAAEARLVELKADRKARSDTLQTMCNTNKAAHDADALTKKAAHHHAAVLAWLAIADALAPDGIPAELLGAALKPINDRLAYHSGLSYWPRVRIATDMSIEQLYSTGADAWRPYPLLSESEKWRADAMIAAAIAELSGLRILLLDRFDVLDAQGREDFIYWLDGLASEGVLDSAIVAGTMKTLPSGLPPTIAGYWVENGTCGALQVAA